MTRSERMPREFSALDRLAQTRAEITDLIAPELAYPGADDGYDSYASSVPPAASARASVGAAAPTTRQAMDRAAQLQRNAASALNDEDALLRTHNRRTAAGREHARRTAEATARQPPAPRSLWSQLLRQGASVWWQRHPAYTAVSLTGSALSHLVIRKPYITLGLAAGFGALLMLIRPWRLVSITGLVIAALKMSDLRGLFGSIGRRG